MILKVVKIGGKLLENDKKLRSFLEDFAALEGAKILVHGGGNLVTELAGKLGFETKMIDGRRITDANSMKLITMVYSGLINKKLVANLQALNCNALGLCGADGKSILATKRPVKPIDFGLVGDVERVNQEFISGLLEQDIVPVFSAISYSSEGELLNTNADSIAAEIAIAMAGHYKTQLYYCFEKKGVLSNARDEDSVIENLNADKYEQLLKEKIISDGMLPKLHNCFYALKNSVSKVFLGNETLLKQHIKHTQISA